MMTYFNTYKYPPQPQPQPRKTVTTREYDEQGRLVKETIEHFPSGPPPPPIAWNGLTPR